MRWRVIPAVCITIASLLRAERLPIRSYTTADGLAANHIDRIVADSHGFLWFCTPEGLSRFDGYRFVNYTQDDGLPGNRILSMLETPSGDYYIGTNRGLRWFSRDGKGARFLSFPPESEVAAKAIHAVTKDASGRPWIAGPEEIYEPLAPRGFRRRTWPEFRLNHISDLIETQGDLLIATTGGIYLLPDDGAGQNLTRLEGLPGEWVESLLLDSKGRVWAATRSGVARFRRNAPGHWLADKVYTQESGLVGPDVKALAEARDGTIWIGTSTGISLLQRDDERPIFHNLTRAQGLTDRQINALAEDRAGNMWAGTEGAGVMKIARGGFTTYREADGLPTDLIISVFEDRAGEIVAVTRVSESGGTKSASIFDGVRFHTVVPQSFGSYISWGWNQVLLQSHTGEWWAATDRGLCRFGKLKAADLDRRQPEACYASGPVFRIFEDSAGGIWASSQVPHGEDKLKRWDPQTGAVADFPCPRVRGQPCSDLVGAFAEDQARNVWMGLYGGGLYRYDGREFKSFSQAVGLPRGSILALLATGSGLWIASEGGGLGRIENPTDEHPRIQIYDTTRGLASNSIYSLVADREGRIYAGTNKGLDRLDPRTGHIRHFSSGDGLADGEFQSAVCDRSGTLWFATKQGLSRLIPELEHSPVAPPVFITDLRLAGKAYPVSQVGETRISKVELKPSENQLQVDFVGIDYVPGEVLRYSYRLEGADSAWSPLRSQHSVNYAALTDGRYRFLVEAVTSEGLESAAPAEIDFTVLPPVWKRWWFQGIALAMVAGLVFAAHRYRVGQAVALERIRVAIATDLHDDIGASLSRIAVLSEVARLGTPGLERAGDPLERIATLSRGLVDSMADIVWSIRSEPLGFDSLVLRMREFALDLLGSQGIEFELRTDSTDDVQLTLQARRQLLLVFKECIHNAARHSGCTTVIAGLKTVDRELVLTVRDNGRGFHSGNGTAGRAGGTGMGNMRARAESLGGCLQVTARPREGCTVEMRIPARRGALFKTHR